MAKRRRQDRFTEDDAATNALDQRTNGEYCYEALHKRLSNFGVVKTGKNSAKGVGKNLDVGDSG